MLLLGVHLIQPKGPSSVRRRVVNVLAPSQRQNVTLAQARLGGEDERPLQRLWRDRHEWVDVIGILPNEVAAIAVVTALEFALAGDMRSALRRAPMR